MSFISSQFRAGLADIAFTVPPIAADGASWPVYAFPTFPHSIYDASATTTWMTYEGWNGKIRVPRVMTYNGSTGAWSNTYRSIAGPLVDDSHGNPSLLMDGNGYVHMFWGPHLQNNVTGQIMHASTLNARDVTVWIPQPGLGDQPNEYPCPVLVGSSIYMLQRVQVGGDLQIGYQIGTVGAAGAVSWAAPVSMASAGASSRLYWANPQLRSGKIHFIATRTDISVTYAVNIYYFVLDPATGAVANYANSHSTAIGSQPISASDCDTYYQILAQPHPSGSGTQAICLSFDSGGNPNILFGDSASRPGSNFSVLHIGNYGSGWTSPVAIGTVQGFFDGLILDDSVNAYWIEGTAPITGSVYMAHRGLGAGGTWTAATLQQPADNNLHLHSMFTAPTPCDPNFRAGWFQVSYPDETDANPMCGTLKGWAIGDNGYVNRSSITLANNAQVIFSPLYKSSGITLSGSNLTATCSNGTTVVPTNVVANVGVTLGASCYWEYLINTDSHPGSEGSGVGFTSYYLTGYVGSSQQSIALYNDGWVVYQATKTVQISPWTTSNVVRVALANPLASGSRYVWFATGSGNWNNNPAANPATGVGGIAVQATNVHEFLPAVELEDPATSVTLRIASGSWSFAAPSGFVAIGA